jgi:predicted phosphate transport protein (TIGR00153 family)
MSLPLEEIDEIENGVYRKSIDLLSDHARKVQDSVRMLVSAFDNFLSLKIADLKSDYQKISVLEEEADDIKRELIEQLTKSAPTFLYREDFLRLVAKVDEVAELAQSISRQVVRLAENKWVPQPSIGDGLKSMSAEVLTTYERLRDAIMALSMNPRRAIQQVGKVHEEESKVDNIYHDLDFKALMEVKKIERLLVYRDLLGLLEHMTDIIEDASDDLRVLALHRVA